MPDRIRIARLAPWIAAGAGCVLVAVVLVAAVLGGPPAAVFASGLSNADSSLIQLQQTDVAAPDFSLTDQHGKRMSLASFRGRPVVLTFNDDECEDLCTLLAEDVAAANRDLGAQASKIAFVSVNANPFHIAVSDVRAWSRDHGLGSASNWYYGTATKKRLAEVAKHYGCDIEADPSTGEVVHCTTIYFIDPEGHERATGGFGSDSANTGPFAHAIAQMAADLADAPIPVAGPSLAAPTGHGAELGDVAPALDLPTLTGDPPNAGGDGKYAIVDFWSSTCTACREQLPALEREYRSLGPAVDFVGIDVDDATARGRLFAAADDATFPSLLDAQGAAAGAWRVSDLPYLVILDPHGRILVRHAGAMTDEQLDYIIRDLDVELVRS